MGTYSCKILEHQTQHNPDGTVSILIRWVHLERVGKTPLCAMFPQNNAYNAPIFNMSIVLFFLPWVTRVETLKLRAGWILPAADRKHKAIIGEWACHQFYLAASVKCHCLPGCHTQRAPLSLQSTFSQEPVTTGNETETRSTSPSSLPPSGTYHTTGMSVSSPASSNDETQQISRKEFITQHLTYAINAFGWRSGKGEVFPRVITTNLYLKGCNWRGCVWCWCSTQTNQRSEGKIRVNCTV